MRLFLTLFLVLLLHLSSEAVGGIWYLEVEITLNGVKTKAYIENGFWAIEKDSIYQNNELLFLKEFKALYQKHPEVTFYTQIEHFDYYVENTAFYIEPYFFDPKNRRVCETKEISTIKLLKIWAKNDIMSEVLTDLSSEDKVWIQKEATKTVHDVPYFHNDLCYLSFYDYAKSPVLLKLVIEIRTMVENEHYDNARFDFIIQLLKANHVVVVNYCGC